jgi:hypothetical protein
MEIFLHLLRSIISQLTLDGDCRLIAEMLLALANTAILCSEPHGTHDPILLSDCPGNPQTPSDWLLKVTLRLATYSQSVQLVNLKLLDTLILTNDWDVILSFSG